MKGAQFINLIILSSVSLSNFASLSLAERDDKSMREARRRREQQRGTTKANLVKKLLKRRAKEGTLRLVDGATEHEGKSQLLRKSPLSLLFHHHALLLPPPRS